jgi:hypothetical protein
MTWDPGQSQYNTVEILVRACSNLQNSRMGAVEWNRNWIEIARDTVVYYSNLITINARYLNQISARGL